LAPYPAERRSRSQPRRYRSEKCGDQEVHFRPRRPARMASAICSCASFPPRRLSPTLLIHRLLIRLIKVSADRLCDLAGGKSRRQETQISPVLADEVDEPGVVDRIATGCVVFSEEGLVGDRGFPDRRKRTGQAHDLRVKGRDKIGKPRRR